MSPPEKSTVLAAAHPDEPYLKHSCLSAIPPELLLCVTDFLPLASQLSLALSHKALYYALWPRLHTKPLYDDEKRIFFQLLERDHPIYVCFACNKLVSYNPATTSRSVAASHSCFQEESARTERLPPQLDFPECMNIIRLRWVPGLLKEVPVFGWADAHLVMTRHRYGEHVGLPLEYLSSKVIFDRMIDIEDLEAVDPHYPLSKHEQVSGDIGPVEPLCQAPGHTTFKFTFEHSTEARIIDDELFISNRHRMTGPPIDQATFVELFAMLTLPVCQHIYTSNPFWPCEREWNGAPACEHCPNLLGLEFGLCKKSWSGSSAGRDLLSSDESVSVDMPSSEVQRCRRCLTDCIVELVSHDEPGGETEQREILLTTWHRIGKCEDPRENEWRRLTDSYTYHEHQATMEGWLWQYNRTRELKVADMWMWNETDDPGARRAREVLALVIQRCAN